VREREQVSAAIHEIVLQHRPRGYANGDLDEEISLGEDGVGLDSIEIVEILLACEELSGQPVTEELFVVLPLTLRRVIDHFVLA
jgi:acyl carrier protein